MKLTAHKRIFALSFAVMAALALSMPPLNAASAQVEGATDTIDITADGWVLYRGHAHPATLDLSGDGALVTDNAGKMSLTGTLIVGDRIADLDLEGIVHEGKQRIFLKGTITDTEDPDKSTTIMLRGHYMPTENDDDGEYAVAFAQASYRDSTGERVRGVLLGDAVLDNI